MRKRQVAYPLARGDLQSRGGAHLTQELRAGQHGSDGRVLQRRSQLRVHGRHLKHHSNIRSQHTTRELSATVSKFVLLTCCSMLGSESICCIICCIMGFCSMAPILGGPPAPAPRSPKPGKPPPAPPAAKGFARKGLLLAAGVGPQGLGRAAELGAAGAVWGEAEDAAAAEEEAEEEAAEAAAASAVACIMGSCTSSYMRRNALNPPGRFSSWDMARS